MGCGKTTLGRALHRRTNLDFIDLDDAVENAAYMSIREIFDTQGEAAFRRMEREQLQRLGSLERPAIVACGGGTPCHPGNMTLMNNSGTTVWLHAPVQVLVERLKENNAQRPLIAAMNTEELQTFVEQTLRLRTPHYALAKHCFNTSELDNQQQLDRAVDLFILRFLSGY